MPLKNTIVLILLIIFSACQNSNVKKTESASIDYQLKSRLERILESDQGIREIVNGNISQEQKAELLEKMNLQTSEVEGGKIFDIMRKVDSTNLVAIEKIFKVYGYPAISLVGEPANMAPFYVIQHSNKVDAYLPIIREAASSGDVPKTSLALMEDRNLMYNGLEQKYGTQIKGLENKEGEWIYLLWPVKNIDSINIWRKEIGFDQDLEDYLKEMNVEFNLYSLEDIEKL